MAKFTMTVEMDNAAFEGDGCGPELARVLLRVAGVVEGLLLRDAAGRPVTGYVADINGNRVGSWEIANG